MNLDTYSQAMRLLIRALTLQLTRKLTPILGQPLTPQSLRLIAEAIHPEIVASRSHAVELAARLFAEQAGLDSVSPRPLRHYPVEALEAGLKPFVMPGPGRVLVRNDLGKIIGVANKHVEDASRREVMSLVRDPDTEAIGWARYDPKTPPTCAFCLTLISRGPKYRDEVSAGGLDEWHTNCSCKAVPVFTRNHWAGREQTLEYARIYTEATRKHGTSINAVRQYLAELNSAAQEAA